ncbi:MAG: SDR family NAD(P)-dependent oxidoreductase [Rhodothermales bacterium]
MAADTGSGKLLGGKVALVTGAGSGIGRTSALLFARQGARVVAADVDAEAGAASVEEITEAGGEACFVQADVSQTDEVKHAVREAATHFGRLDVLFNVVGVSGRRWGDGPTAECTEEAWDRVLAINLKSIFLCCKYALQEMLRQGGGGAIVNLSSVLGLVGGDTDFATHAYAASKGGIISLTRSIASYYAPQGIRANVICPGLIATPMSARAQANETIRAKLPALQPLTGDFGRPEDVAHAALYLASDQAAFVTGAVLTVDGGWTMR